MTKKNETATVVVLHLLLFYLLCNDSSPAPAKHIIVLKLINLSKALVHRLKRNGNEIK